LLIQAVCAIQYKLFRDTKMKIFANVLTAAKIIFLVFLSLDLVPITARKVAPLMNAILVRAIASMRFQPREFVMRTRDMLPS
jgi:hypothetical protein